MELVKQRLRQTDIELYGYEAVKLTELKMAEIARQEKIAAKEEHARQKWAVLNA